MGLAWAKIGTCREDSAHRLRQSGGKDRETIRCSDQNCAFWRSQQLIFLFVSLPSARGAIQYSGDIEAGSPHVPSDPNTWISSTTGYIGYDADATVTVDGGSDLLSRFGYIGYDSGAVGDVTVSGNGSTWTNSLELDVGRDGNGTLSITGGGAVSSGVVSYLGYNSGSSGVVTVNGGSSTLTGNTVYVGFHGNGTLNIGGGSVISAAGPLYVSPFAGSSSAINFETGGGTLTSGTLYASPVHVTGTGTINTRGLISDVVLMFDQNHGLSQMLQWNGTVSVTLDMSNPSNVGDLGAGWNGSGFLTIRDGVAIQSHSGYIGGKSSSTGTATVHGIGTTWTNNGDLAVGCAGSGSLSVTGGAAVSNAWGYIGWESGSTGAVTVDGNDSTWTNNLYLYVGRDGSGSLNVSGGGTVSSHIGYLGCNSGAIGAATVDGETSTWTTNDFALYVGASGNGTLCVTGGGTVSSGNVYIGADTTSQGTARVEGASTWTNSGDLYIGASGNGRLEITGGATVDNGLGYIGCNSDSTGVVIVHGAGSTWTNRNSLYVGSGGNGVLNITGGSAVTNRLCFIGEDSGASGAVTVDGAGSTWTNDGPLDVGLSGTGTLKITGGGAVSSSGVNIGYFSDMVSVVAVDGSGSTWTNTNYLRVGNVGPGALSVVGGGVVVTTNISISNESVLAIDVGNGSSVIVNGGGGTVTNNGIVQIVAGSGAPSGNWYQPISAASCTGTFQAIGGTWNASTRTFTVSDVGQGTAGTPVSIDLLGTQRVQIDDSATGWSLGASFLASQVSKPLSFTGTTIDSSTLASLLSSLEPNDSIAGAWQCTATGGYTTGDPAYLSFNGAGNYTPNDLTVWRYDGGWSRYDAMDLTVNGPWASFTVTSFSGYAVTAGPAHVSWSGAATPTWSPTAGSGNWKKTANGVSADYCDGFHVTFEDSAASTSADISNVDVAPLSLTFNNSTKNVTITGTKGIVGSTTVTKRGTGTVTMASVNRYTGLTIVEAGKLVLQGVSKAIDPVLNKGGANIMAGNLVLDYGTDADPASTVDTLMKASYASGNWNTGKFQSSTHTTADGLGWIDNATSKQITVAYTLYGDANVDGSVNLSDLGFLGDNYGTSSGMTWADGDFNYDGKVNLADLGFLGDQYGRHATGLLPTGPLGTAPEPSSLLMLALVPISIGAWGLRRPRR